ncbi:quorum-sensing system protein StcA [Streptococcus pyogenes]|uniref:quorum-sensing system protein StcA n=1 Tax=Streptococcus pyogenes TaxID=1314 RepID=UPI0011E78D70|nr:quorum-sensing system protein StcA [Streptococcus pyogenes]TYK79754.1 quorum-sensing system protein StcA [Streptococcus pyogenes]HER2474895.1 quorum-sensing system protein StcA [Streptococcus pyogenes]
MTKKQFYLILAISILCFILAVSPKPPIPKHTIERKRTAMTIGHSKQNPHKKEALKHKKNKNKTLFLPSGDSAIKSVISMTVRLLLDNQS